jgi:hypothetical protein
MQEVGGGLQLAAPTMKKPSGAVLDVWLAARKRAPCSHHCLSGVEFGPKGQSSVVILRPQSLQGGPLSHPSGHDETWNGLWWSRSRERWGARATLALGERGAGRLGRRRSRPLGWFWLVRCGAASDVARAAHPVAHILAHILALGLHHPGKELTRPLAPLVGSPVADPCQPGQRPWQPRQGWKRRDGRRLSCKPSGDLEHYILGIRGFEFVYSGFR